MIFCPQRYNTKRRLSSVFRNILSGCQSKGCVFRFYNCFCELLIFDAVFRRKARISPAQLRHAPAAARFRRRRALRCYGLRGNPPPGLTSPPSSAVSDRLCPVEKGIPPPIFSLFCPMRGAPFRETRSVERNLLLASERCVVNAQRRAEPPTNTSVSARTQTAQSRSGLLQKNTTFAPSNNRV